MQTFGTPDWAVLSVKPGAAQTEASLSLCCCLFQLPWVCNVQAQGECDMGGAHHDPLSLSLALLTGCCCGSANITNTQPWAERQQEWSREEQEGGGNKCLQGHPRCQSSNPTCVRILEEFLEHHDKMLKWMYTGKQWLFLLALGLTLRLTKNFKYLKCFAFFNCRFPESSYVTLVQEMKRNRPDFMLPYRTCASHPHCPLSCAHSTICPKELKELYNF